MQRRPNQKKRATLRLNLQWATASGVPEGMSISGEGVCENQALMAALEPGLIDVMDCGYASFALLDRITHSCCDFVVRLKSSIVFKAIKELPLSDEDRAAGGVPDRIGRLCGSLDNAAPGAMLREVTFLDPDRPDHPVRILTSLTDVPAAIIGQFYRHRWQIELFFRWLKVHAHFEHLISHSKNGVTTGFYMAVIAVLLMYVHTQRPVSKYAYAMLSLVAAGRATLQTILPILERRERQCELDRQLRAGKKAKKLAFEWPPGFAPRLGAKLPHAHHQPRVFSRQATSCSTANPTRPLTYNYRPPSVESRTVLLRMTTGFSKIHI